MKKYKMTGCARFFIFLIIFVPALYFGVSYYNGENGLQNLKDFLGIESNEGVNEAKNAHELTDLESELANKDEQIKDLTEKVENLEEQLKEKEKEISELKEGAGN